MWTLERLQGLVRDRLAGFRFICVSNREPYIHVHAPEGVRCLEPASGVVTALDPVMRATGGTWVAHGSGSADREIADAAGHIGVPPGHPQYLLRRVWLTKEEEKGYYYGFANETLWPLCHHVYKRPTFNLSDWNQYVAVNRKFADAVVEEAAGARALVFLQDYHFALLAGMIKDRLPSAVVFQFWHIPWPNPEVFRICPWKLEILRGLLRNDLLAFHIQYHCNNFIDTIDREVESRIDREHFRITSQGSTTLIRPHPISIDFEEISRQAAAPETVDDMERLRRELRLKGVKVVLGVDRLDYTKGIPERLRAFDRFLGTHPEFIEKVVLLELGVPSRTHIRAYQEFIEEIESLIKEINGRHRTPTWDPIVFAKEHKDRRELIRYYRLADVCMVTSLHDGMNLVAKEFVAARVDGRGVLLLSRFTGAARELEMAVQVNPFSVDGMASALHQALAMSPDEQASRMERLRETVRHQNVYKWVAKLLWEAARLEPT
jgi:alpha,alpha-trehalose-phosphate synthase [UDP-forming]